MMSSPKLTLFRIVAVAVALGVGQGRVQASSGIIQRSRMLATRGGGGILKQRIHEKLSLDSIPKPGKSKKTASLDSIPWNHVGNTFNILSLLSVIYLGWNFAHVNEDSSYYGTPPLSKQFLNDGFCIKNRYRHWSSSHAACFYADIVLSAALFKLMDYFKKDIEDRNLQVDYLQKMVPISTIVHGVGHLLISFLDKSSSDPPGNVAIAITTVIYFAVFYALFAASSPTIGSETTYSMQKRRKRVTYTINIIAFLCAAVAAWIWNKDNKFHSIQVGFTYVQTLTITYAAVVQLFILPKESKTMAYAAWAIIVTFMVNMVGWWIAVDCQRILPGLQQTVLELWGHLWYDSYLAISYMLFLYFGLKFIPPNIIPVVQKWRWLRFWEK